MDKIVDSLSQYLRDLDSEDIRGELTRRRLLYGGAAVVVGRVVLSGQSDEDQPSIEEQLTTAETQFASTATTIDDTDVTDPQSIWKLRDEVDTAVDTVAPILNQDFPNDPEIEQRVSSLRTAKEYYSIFLMSLAEAESTYRAIDNTEIDVLNHGVDTDLNPRRELETTSFEQSITQLADAEREPREITSQGRTLVPNQQAVVSSLLTQREVFERYIRAQQSYLDSATAIEAGVRAFEQSRFDDAQANLLDARDSLLISIFESGRSYRLSTMGLTLDQYEELFRLREEGVSELLAATKESVSESEQRSVANTALNKFFEARDLLPI